MKRGETLWAKMRQVFRTKSEQDMTSTRQNHRMFLTQLTINIFSSRLYFLFASQRRPSVLLLSALSLSDKLTQTQHGWYTPQRYQGSIDSSLGESITKVHIGRRVQGHQSFVIHIVAAKGSPFETEDGYGLSAQLSSFFI